MKKALAVVFALVPPLLFAQVRVYNSSLLDTSKFQLYQYAENRIVVSGVRATDRVEVNSMRSEVYKLSGNEFRLSPSGTGTDSLYIYINVRLLKKQVFIIDTFPDLIVRVGHHSDTVLTHGQILSAPFLRAFYPGSNYGQKIYISSFYMTGETRNGDPFFETGYGHQFSEQQVAIIQNSPPGTRLFFTDIRAHCASGRSRKLPPFSIILK